MSKFFRALVIVGMVVGLFAVVPKLIAGDDPPPPHVVEIPETVQGKTAADWHAIAARYLNRQRSLAAAIRFDPEVTSALNLACVVYGHCAELWRKARCESHLRRFASNGTSSARGLLQFLTTGRVRRYGDRKWVNGGTWATTPYWRLSVFDPYANALAAGWMHAHLRGGEWVCQ